MSAAPLIPFDLPLPVRLPTIEGNVDYKEFRTQLLRIDQLLLQSGIESQFIKSDLEHWLARRKQPSAKAQQNRQFHSRCASCNIARLLVHEDFRGFAAWPTAHCSSTSVV